MIKKLGYLDHADDSQARKDSPKMSRETTTFTDHPAGGESRLAKAQMLVSPGLPSKTLG